MKERNKASDSQTSKILKKSKVDIILTAVHQEKIVELHPHVTADFRPFI